MLALGPAAGRGTQLAARWQVASVHRNGPDLVFGYRNAKRVRQLIERSGGRLKVIQEKDAYFRI
jgi:hypothetical protein